MKHAASRELYAYWNRIRGNEAAPWRSAIEPGDIRRILADTFIAEAVDPQNFNIRLAGTRVCALYGNEIKGRNLLDFWTAEDRSALASLAAAVTEDAAAAVLTTEAFTIDQKTTVCELLLLPLKHGPERYDRMVGSLAPLNPPYWLGSDPVVEQRIVSLRLIWPDQNPSFSRRRTDKPSEIRVAAAGSTSLTRKGRRRGHLFVVDGGKN